MSFCLKLCYYPPMFVCYYVSKAYVLLSYKEKPHPRFGDEAVCHESERTKLIH